MGRLSTHVLDIQTGRPAAGVVIDLVDVASDGATRLIKTISTNADGRTDAPLLVGDDFRTGVFELRFHVGDYFRRSGQPSDKTAFLDIIPIRFGVGEADGHYHVPLLVSPWAYSTYRGS